MGENPASKEYPDNFCAYNTSSGTSKPGDSGGPFICEENGFAILHGIHYGTTYDEGDVIENYVFKHIEFIKNYMEEFPEP